MSELQPFTPFGDFPLSDDSMLPVRDGMVTVATFLGPEDRQGPVDGGLTTQVPVETRDDSALHTSESAAHLGHIALG